MTPVFLIFFAFFLQMHLIRGVGDVWEGKQYKNYESQNYDEYLEALGASPMMRKLVVVMLPTISLSKHGDQYILTTDYTFNGTFKHHVIEFELGKEFDETTQDGRHITNIITLEGNKLTQVRVGPNPSTIIREFAENEMVTTMTIGNATAIRKYKAI